MNNIFKTIILTVIISMFIPIYTYAIEIDPDNEMYNNFIHPFNDDSYIENSNGTYTWIGINRCRSWYDGTIFEAINYTGSKYICGIVGQNDNNIFFVNTGVYNFPSTGYPYGSHTLIILGALRSPGNYLVVHSPNYRSNTTIENTFSIPIFMNIQDAYEYYVNGDSSKMLNSPENMPGYIEGGIGHIRNTKYSLDNTNILHNPSQFREYIEWDPVSSNTGYEYKDGDIVEFYIKDRSYKTQVNTVGILEFQDQVSKQLAKWVYPKGDARNMIASGSATKSSMHGQMSFIDFATATLGVKSLNSLSAYKNSGYVDNDVKNYVDLVTGGSGTYSWWEKGYDFFYGNKMNINLAYDIYALVRSGNNTGEWYRIDFHDTPVPNRSERTTGGITVSPVTPVTPFNPDSTGDWFNAPDFVETPDKDEDGNDIKNSVSIYYHNDEGDTYITNNNTYYYDNRTWIENNYTDETIGDVNEGLEWTKLFARFFGIFLTLFGAFLPPWAVALVTAASPIVLGLVIFRVIKGVIPFV